MKAPEEIWPQGFVISVASNLPSECFGRFAAGAGLERTTTKRYNARPPPNNLVLVIGHVLVYSDSGLPTPYGLAKQIPELRMANAPEPKMIE